MTSLTLDLISTESFAGRRSKERDGNMTHFGPLLTLRRQQR
jgi:hypothetical protein